jgi:Tfp pilus assembly protein PilF
MSSKSKKKGKSVKTTARDTPRAGHRRASGGGVQWLLTPFGAALAVFVVAIAVYGNTIGHDFVWDDYSLIVDNHAVRTLDPETVKAIFTEDSWKVAGRGGGYYRPIVTLSYHLDYKLFGGNSTGFHLTNVFFNAAACLMAFVFVYLLFGDILLGLLTALIFTIHPMHTEVVAWVSGRTDLLATFWSLVSLSCYVLARRRHQAFLFAGALVAFVLAMLSKESAACLPLLVAVMEIGPFDELLAGGGPQPAPVNRTVRAIVSVGLFLAVLVLYAIVRRDVIGVTTSTYGAYAPGALGSVALPLSIFVGYVAKVLLPLRLAAEYDAPIPQSFANVHVIGGLVAAALVVWMVWRFHRRADVVLGAAVFVLGLGPVLNIIPIGEVSAERFLYFPSLGVALILGGLVASALRKRHASLRMPSSVVRWGPSRSTAGMIVVIALIAFVAAGARVFARNADWRDEGVLFAKNVQQDPGNPRAQANMARVAQRAGDVRGAIAAYEKSLEINPDYPVALNGLAEMYGRQGRYDQALPLIERALAISPDEPKFINNLGSIYFETQRFDEAAEQFERALQLDPGELRTHFNLGLIRMQQGSLDQARSHFEHSARGGEDFYVAYLYLAMIERAAGDAARAKQYAQEFLSRHTTNDDLRRQAEAIVRGE